MQQLISPQKLASDFLARQQLGKLTEIGFNFLFKLYNFGKQKEPLDSGERLAILRAVSDAESNLG